LLTTESIKDDDDEPTTTIGDGGDNESNFTVKPKMTIDDLLQDSDDEFDDGQSTTKSRRSTKSKMSVWIKETNDEPLDLTEPSAATKIYATKPLTKKQQELMKKEQNEKRRKNKFRTSADGRLIIVDDDDDTPAKINNNDDTEMDEQGGEIKNLMETLSIGKKNNKRKHVDDDDFDDDGEDLKSKNSQQSKYKAGGSGIHRQINKKKAAGQNYKAKKGSGDIKISNKHDPYAYIKLDFNALNKRKRSQFKNQFENFVGAAKRNNNSKKSGGNGGGKKKERKVKRLRT